MKFEYKRISPGVLRPVVPIEIGHNDFFVSYEVLVDSGADMCIFDAEIGELIGIDITKGEKKEVYGITGARPEYYYLHPIKIKVGGWPFSIKAGFLPNLNSRQNYGVVGQIGFFDLFVVKFDLIKEEIEVNPRKK